MIKPRSIFLIAAALALFASGCDTQTQSAKPPPQMPTVDNTSAEQAARSWLLLTQTLLRARAHHDEATETKALAEMRRLIYLPKVLIDSLTKADDRVRGENNMVNNWAAGVAFYSEGYDWAGLRADAPRAAGGPVEIRVPARGKTGAAVIDLLCVSTDQGWRIRAVQLLPESAAATPASQPPASQPAAPQPRARSTAASAPTTQP